MSKLGVLLLISYYWKVNASPLDATPKSDRWAHHRTEAATSGTDLRNNSGLIEAVNFMKRFGYLRSGDRNASFIFSLDGIQERLKLVQKFGAIPQTGELDRQTIELMQKPRCGVHDVDETIKHRRKRFIVGGKGWNKRKLTYHVANWSPKLWSKENVQMELRKAFDAWTKYSYLQFEETPHSDADIVIFFASYQHSDGYPFDGQGGVLAHAYYPYESGHYGGDIHFDESEEWVIDPKDEQSGLDFFTVAVHEIGHSLGLAHSHAQSSIMFPYYKGHQDNFALDYDDIMGMWELYIRRRLDGDDEFFNTTTTTTATTPTTAATTPPTPTTSTSSYDVAQNDATPNGGSENDVTSDNDDKILYHGDSETVDQHKKRTDTSNANSPTLPPLFPGHGADRNNREEEARKRAEERDRRTWQQERKRQEEEIRRREEEERRRWQQEDDQRWNDWHNGQQTTTLAPHTTSAASIPDICEGVDSVAMIRDELFFFKGKYMWRFKDQGTLVPGYPAPILAMFPGLPTWLNKLDAVYQRPSDSYIVFFIGKYYYVHNGVRVVEETQPLTRLGVPEAITEIDAAFFWPKNNRTYLFRRNLYWRRDDLNHVMEPNYPRGIDKWNGLPQDLDGVFTDKMDISYFFKNNEVWRYDNELVAPTGNSPSRLSPAWISC